MDIESPAKPFADDLSLSDEDLYLRMKETEAEIEFINLQEEFIREEHKNLKKELLRAKEEIKRIQAVPLVIGQFVEMIDMQHGATRLTQASSPRTRARPTSCASSASSTARSSKRTARSRCTKAPTQSSTSSPPKRTPASR